MEIAFCMLNARHSPLLIRQVAARLAPHRLFLHHDYSQYPDFAVHDPRITLVPAPRATAWGDWSLTEAILHTMDFCLRESRFDYLQLLSPTCLPGRPMREFEAHVRYGGQGFHCDRIDLFEGDDALVTYAQRFLARRGTLGFRLLSRLKSAYFGPDPRWRQRAGLVVLGRPGRNEIATPSARLKGLARREWLAVLRHRIESIGVFDRYTRPMVGSTWFGATRAGCESLGAAPRDGPLRRYFADRHISDELFVPTLAGNSGLPIGPSNHFISPFQPDGHPRELTMDDLSDVRASGRFFARKFPAEPDSPVRRYLPVAQPIPLRQPDRPRWRTVTDSRLADSR